MSEELHPKMYMYKRIVEAKLFIDDFYHENIDLNSISNQSHFSKYHFLRLFKDAFGKSPHQYLIEVRISKAKELLYQNHTVKAACFEVGFESVPSFIALFKRRIGVTPNEFVKKIKLQKEEKLKTPLAFIPNCFVENYGWNK